MTQQFTSGLHSGYCKLECLCITNQNQLSECVQEMMLTVGVLGYVVPLLFGFDPTHDSVAGAPEAGMSAVASLTASPEEAPSQHDAGPAYLGLGTSRSNMQASLPHTLSTSCTPGQSVSLRSCICAIDRHEASPGAPCRSTGCLT